MKVHLFRSAELHHRQFSGIADLVLQYSGPVKYIFRDEDIEWDEDDLSEEILEGKKIREKDVLFDAPPGFHMFTKRKATVLSWDTIFTKCEDFRKLYQIPDHDPVVLLTHHVNEKNWFSSWDPSGKRNFFIHTSMWEHFVEADSRYPIIYELASIPLFISMFNDFRELLEYAHREPRGCLCDLCQDKRQIVLKLRTADICKECMELTSRDSVDQRIVNQFFEMVSDIRKHMLFRKNYPGSKQPPGMIYDIAARRLHFPDAGNVSVRLSPVENRVYRLFMNHPEGFSFTDLMCRKDLGVELLSYFPKNGPDASEVNTAKEICEKLIFNLEDSLSQHISRIKRKLIDALGSELAEYYMIKGGKNKTRKIFLPRNLVTVRQL